MMHHLANAALRGYGEPLVGTSTEDPFERLGRFMAGTVHLGVARAVITSTTDALLFERFCNDVVSKLEGDTPVLSTSRTWDLGRDGRSIGRGPAILVCASLRDDVDTKAEGDLKRVAKFPGKKVDKLYFCSSQTLSEKRANDLAKELVPLLPDGITIEVLGANHLADACVNRCPSVLSQHFKSEIDDVVRAFAPSSSDEEQKAEGAAMQLALATISHDDSASIRHTTYRVALRGAMADGDARNVAELARDVSAHLRLARNLPEALVRTQLASMESDGEVSEEQSRFFLTDLGKQLAVEQAAQATSALLQGRQKMRKQLETELGQTLTEDHYALIWHAIQGRITHFFYERGKQMITWVTVLMSEADAEEALGSEAFEDSRKFVDELAEAAGATSSSKEQAVEIATALRDIFMERSGPAFDWLVSTCASFVGLCSLGLEATSGEQVARAISRMTFVLDTDVVLSLLGEGEMDHGAVVEVTQRLRELGATVLFAQPVLVELAHHAWISEANFQGVKTILPLNELDRIRYIENVFVRAFAALLERKRIKFHQWNSFRDQYRGATKDDAAKLVQTLTSEFGFGTLPRAPKSLARLEGEVRAFLDNLTLRRTPRGDREERIRQDKARRDAELYASLVAHRQSMHTAGNTAGCYLVTSSARLSKVHSEFKTKGERSYVLSIAALVHLLSLAPGVSFGKVALRTLLFDVMLRDHAGELERLVMRVLRESGEFSLPWARRTKLRAEIESRIIAGAKEEALRDGKPRRSKGDAVQEVMKPENAETLVQIIRDSLDSAAAGTRAEDEIAALKKQVADLQARLARRSDD